MLDISDNFYDFENACATESEINNFHLMSIEDLSITNSKVKKLSADMDKFVDKIAKKNIKSSAVAKQSGFSITDDDNGRIVKTRVGLLDATRGDKINLDTIIYDKLCETCGPKLLKNIPNFRTFIGKFVADHMSEMSFRGPGKRLLWTHDDEFLQVCGVDKKDIIDAIKASDYILPSWTIANKPINMFMTFACFYLWNNMDPEEKKAVNDPNKYKTTNCYLANLVECIRFYTSINYKYFPYEVKEDLMVKTIEELSERYTFSGIANIFEYLNNTAASNLLNAVDLYKKPTDYNLKYFMDNIDSRINVVLKGIASAYYENVNNNVDIQTDKFEMTNDEGDRAVNIPQTMSADIEIIVRKLAIKLSSSSKVIDKYLIVACKETLQSISRMRSTMQSMIDNDKENVINLIRKIITYYIAYLKKDKKTIRSINFISLMKKTYNVSNTIDHGLMEIKDALNKLLENNSKEYLKTSRVASLSAMKSCVFYYWLLYINDKAEG